VASRIELDLATHQNRRKGPTRPASERLHPGQQLLKGKRLREVVVRSERQPLDDLIELTRRGEGPDPSARSAWQIASP
jgi:hypothetical protein